MNVVDIIPYLENILNTKLQEEAKDNELLDNERETFLFHIVLDAGDYKAFDYLKRGAVAGTGSYVSSNPTNKFVNYINGVLTVNETNIEGVEETDEISTISTTLELLVPLRNLDDEESTMELIGTIRKVVDKALSYNQFAQIGSYNLGISYSMGGTGSRDLRMLIGDSISLYSYITFVFVANGVNSAEIEVEIDGIKLASLRKGYSRVANQESDIASDSETGSAGCITSNTVFTLNFDKPVQKTELDKKFANYLLTGTSPVFDVEITEPVINGSITTKKKMIISEVTRNTDTTLNASETVTMVEALV